MDNTTKTLTVLSDTTANANNTLVLVENVVDDIAKDIDDILRSIKDFKISSFIYLV